LRIIDLATAHLIDPERLSDRGKCPRRISGFQIRHFWDMVPSMAFTGNNDLIEIEKRNCLRAEVGLPLLSAETQAARDQAASQREFERRRPEIRHQWIGNRDRLADQHGPMFSCPPNRREKRCERAEFDARQPYRLDTQSARLSRISSQATMRGTSMGEELTFTMMT
jgi:hypothetical protein